MSKNFVYTYIFKKILVFLIKKAVIIINIIVCSHIKYPRFCYNCLPPPLVLCHRSAPIHEIEHYMPFYIQTYIHTLCIILPTLLTAVIHNNKTFGHPFLQQRVNLHRKGSIFTTNHLFIVAFHFGICGALFVIAMLYCLYFKRCFFFVFGLVEH